MRNGGTAYNRHPEYPERAGATYLLRPSGSGSRASSLIARRKNRPISCMREGDRSACWVISTEYVCEPRTKAWSVRPSRLQVLPSRLHGIAGPAEGPGLSGSAILGPDEEVRSVDPVAPQGASTSHRGDTKRPTLTHALRWATEAGAGSERNGRRSSSSAAAALSGLPCPAVPITTWAPLPGAIELRTLGPHDWASTTHQLPLHLSLGGRGLLAV